MDQEFKAELATMELRIVREMNAIEDRTRTRIEALKSEIAGNPETFAGLKAGLATAQDDIDELKTNNRTWAALTTIISATIASAFAWLTGR